MKRGRSLYLKSVNLTFFSGEFTMKFILILMAAFWAMTGYRCLPYGKGAKNNMKKVAIEILHMLSGECQMYNYVDTIEREGCEPVQIENKFCGGKCISRYYPGFAYCTACMPRKIIMKKVFFKCPDDPVKKVRHRRIHFVQDCQCRRFLCKT